MNFQEERSLGGQSMNGGIGGGAGKGGLINGTINSMHFQGSAGGWHIKQKPLMGLLGTGGGAAYVAGGASAGPTPVTYVVIAGGGGGGNDCGGGGGAGGYLTGTTPDLDIDTNMTVTVGGGAAGGTPGDPGGDTGANSIFDTAPATYTGLGGGAGGGFTPTQGGDGGSGGAGRREEPQGPTVGRATNYPGPTAQGYPAVNPMSSTPTGQCSSGGGGAAGHGGIGDPTGAGGGGKAVPQPILAVPTITKSGNGWVSGGGGGGVDTPTIRIGFGGGNNPGSFNGGVPPTNGTLSGGAGGGGGPDNPTGDWLKATPGNQNSGGGGGGGAGNGGPAPSGGTNPDYRHGGTGANGVVAIVYPNLHTVTNPGGGLTIDGPHPHSPTENKTIFTAGTGTIQLTGA